MMYGSFHVKLDFSDSGVLQNIFPIYERVIKRTVISLMKIHLQMDLLIVISPYSEGHDLMKFYSARQKASK
jgi:hypothetical protein